MSADLTADEQRRVRAALRLLRARAGRWDMVAKMLHMTRRQLCNVMGGACSVTPTTAFRVARVAGVGVDDVLTGKYPPAGVCVHCGHAGEEAAQ